MCSGHGHFFGNRVRLGAARPLRLYDAEHLRNNVAGALDRHRVADTDVEPRDLVGIVQRRVLHHDAADGHRLELGDRRQRAGAADLDLDVSDDGGRLLGREFVRDRPARRARDEAEPLLPVEPVDLVDDAVDVVVERRALRLDLAMECSSCSTERHILVSGLVLKPQDSNHLIMPDWVSAGISLISPQP